jgi:hypothetical protein
MLTVHSVAGGWVSAMMDDAVWSSPDLTNLLARSFLCTHTSQGKVMSHGAGQGDVNGAG